MHIKEIVVKGIVHITWCCATPRLSGKNTGLSFEKSQLQICIPQQLCLWLGTFPSLLHSLVEEDSSQWSPGCLITSSLEPVHICSWYTYLGKCSRNKFSVHKRSDCEHCEMFSVPLHSDFKSAHVSVCAVWLLVHILRNVLKNNTRLMRSFLTHALHADSGLRAKPRPVRTCSRFRIVSDFVSEAY